MSTSNPSDRPARRFGPYPEDAAQDAIWRQLDPDAFADEDGGSGAAPSAAVAPAARTEETTDG